MDQRNKNMDTQLDMDKLTVKEALAMDVAQISMRRKIIVDPYMPFLPITPLAVGKKVIEGVQSVLGIVKTRIK